MTVFVLLHTLGKKASFSENNRKGEGKQRGNSQYNDVMVDVILKLNKSMIQICCMLTKQNEI